jgi:hypothetical protein
VNPLDLFAQQMGENILKGFQKATYQRHPGETDEAYEARLETVRKTIRDQRLPTAWARILKGDE